MASHKRSRTSNLATLVIVLAAGNSSAAPAPGREKSHETAQASARIMKELMEIYKSDSYKKGVFQVEPVDDNLYEWNVKLFFNAGKTLLGGDLQRLKQSGGRDDILVRVSFGGNYPNDPPFARVIYPTLMRNNITEHGSVCMYELSKRGWVSEFTMEGILLMIIHLFETVNRVNFLGGDQMREQEYTEEKARKAFERQMKGYGWDTERPEHLPWFKTA